MNAPSRLAVYGAGLAVVLAGGWFLGDRVNLDTVESSTGVRTGHGGTPASDVDAGQNDDPGVPGGLQVAQDGYSLDLVTAGYGPGRQQLDFRIVGPDGRPVTDYQRAHDKDLHLIVVRRDFAGFQHVHPALDTATGTWSVQVNLDPGTWRVFADFVPAGGEGLTLGADLLVDGDPGRQQLPTPRRTVTIDGYTVAVTGDLQAGSHSMLEFTISRDGRAVTDLEPWLGAYGHLVALREGDLAYLHVHPDGEPGDGVTEPGPNVSFGAEVPSAGRYHLFLDFKVAGTVHAAAFTLDASRAADALPEDDAPAEHHDHDHQH